MVTLSFGKKLSLDMHEPNEALLIWPSKACYVVAGLFGVACVFFACYGILLAVAANGLWACFFLLCGWLFGALSEKQQLMLARLLTSLERWARSAAPMIGLFAGCAFVMAAMVMFTCGNLFFAMINAFWAVALPVAGLLWKRMGFARTASLCALTAGLGFLATATVMFEYREPMLVWMNAFWGVLFLATAYVLDSRRKILEHV